MVNWSKPNCCRHLRAVGSIAADYCPAAVNRRPSLQVISTLYVSGAYC